MIRLSDTPLAEEFHPSLNSPFFAINFASKSAKKVWWLCEKGHEWEAVIYSRANGRGCPVCAGRKTETIATSHPELIVEWHPTKNGNLLLDSLTSGSAKKVWWLCEKGHEWEAVINNRIKGSGCPFCSGRNAIKDVTSVMVTNPEIVAEWHPTKNVYNVDLSQFSAGSSQRVWWLCSQGHEWQAAIKNRIAGQQGCPVCVGRKVVKGFNDLVTTHPLIAAQWHPTKNLPVNPIMVSAGSQQKYWWLGNCGHEWKTTVASRVSGSDCRTCFYRNNIQPHSVPTNGVDDLRSQHPKLASQWSIKNAPLQADQFKAHSHQRIVWECENNHEWEAVISERVRGSNCPTCSAQAVTSQGERDVASFLNKLGLEVKMNNRQVLGGKSELDIFIPSLSVGVEYNGIYWHSEASGKDKDYHSRKYTAAQIAGITLIQIWEDDWLNRQPVVMRALAHKLGLANELALAYPEFKKTSVRSYARKTSATLINTQQARTFLETNHIQGFASGTYYLALEDTAHTLQAVMVLKREADNVLNIVRYATASIVTGGFTKLLSHAKKTYTPSSFITFADHTISDGGLYEKHGFVVDKLIPPDYMYVVRSERKHKFGYRLKKFRNDPNLLWEEGLTERELAALNKIPRIWDAGKTRYRLNVK